MSSSGTSTRQQNAPGLGERPRASVQPANRRLGVEGCEQFEGRGVYDAATLAEAQLCAGDVVVVLGGGNSAGQAAVFLPGYADAAKKMGKG